MVRILVYYLRLLQIVTSFIYTKFEIKKVIMLVYRWKNNCNTRSCSYKHDTRCNNR